MQEKIYNSIVDIIKDILEENDVISFNPKQPIVESGLNSLQFVNVVVEIENMFNVELPDDFLEEFALKNIDDMSRCIEKMREGNHE